MRHHLARLILAGIPFLPLGAQAEWQVDGAPISTAAGDQADPLIVSDGAGGAIVTWIDRRGGYANYDIYAQRVNASGTPQWTADGVALCTAANNQSSPTIVTDGAGGAIVTWIDQRSEGSGIYAQRVNASGTPQWTADGVALCTAAGGQYFPRIVSDGAGGAIVTWTDNRSGYPKSDVYAQRVSASGVPQWTADGVALSTAGASTQYFPTLISDGAGGAIVTWYDRRSGSYHIYAQRLNAAGARQWTGNGVAVCTAAGGQGSPKIVSNGAGGAIVTWTDHRSDYLGRGIPNPDIYAQLVNASGKPQWTGDGVALCTAPDEQVSLTIASDGAGGAVVTWEDLRNGVDYNIYARRVNALGVAQWTADGVALCTEPFYQYDPTIVSDGAGGAIVTWEDPRGGINFDIYAQRVNASGTPQWTTAGVALCTAANDQRDPTIVSDGAGGAIVTWIDRRAGTYDIYAQHVTASGDVRTTVAGPTRGPSLIVGQVYPNPFAGTASLEIELGAPSVVRLEIVDVAGRRVRVVTSRDAAGSQRVEFDGRDDAGRLLPSGVYFYRVYAAGETITRKMVIARQGSN